MIDFYVTKYNFYGVKSKQTNPVTVCCSFIKMCVCRLLSRLINYCNNNFVDSHQDMYSTKHFILKVIDLLLTRPAISRPYKRMLADSTVVATAG